MNHLKPKRSHDQLWRYLLISVLTFIISTIITPIIASIIGIATAAIKGQSIDLFIENIGSLTTDPVVALITLMLPIAISFGVTVFLVKKLLKRSFSQVINGTKKIRWQKFFYAAGVWGLLMVILTGVSFLINPENFTIQFDVTTFIPLLLVAIILIPLQTTAEEFVFRGYLMQKVATYTRKKWIIILTPALLFMAVHLLNPEVFAYDWWFILPTYLVYGIMFGILTVWDDGIELSMGLHAINNIIVSVFVSAEVSAIGSAALIIDSGSYQLLDFILFISISVVFLYLMVKKYKFKAPCSKFIDDKNIEIQK